MKRKATITNRSTLKDRSVTIETNKHGVLINGIQFYVDRDSEGNTVYHKISYGVIKGRDGICRPTKRFIRYVEYKN